VSSKPAKSVPLLDEVLSIDPAPLKEPIESEWPLTFSHEPAPRVRRLDEGTASPLAVTMACETVVPPLQLPLSRSKVVAVARAVCASNPEKATAPPERTGTWTTRRPRALRERPAPR